MIDPRTKLNAPRFMMEVRMIGGMARYHYGEDQAAMQVEAATQHAEVNELIKAEGGAPLIVDSITVREWKGRTRGRKRPVAIYE